MTHHSLKSIVLTALLAAFCLAPLQAVPLDKIVAIVDKDIILQSDLEEMREMYKAQPMFQNLEEDKQLGFILERLIDEKIMTTIAERDTDITVTEGELELSTKNYLQQLYDQNGGEFTFEDLLKKSKGINLAEFKKQLKQQMREQRLKQKLQEKYMGKLEPTHLQVKKFYQEYRDSLPKLKDNYKISHLEYSVKPNRKLLAEAFKKCDSIIQKLNKGEEFALLAKRYSDDPSGAEGGDLGYLKKGTLDPDYERFAFALKEGDYTRRPVQTSLGYHIIKSTGKKDNEVRSSHILIRVIPTSEDTLRTFHYLDSLAKTLKTETDFSKMAKRISEDKETRNTGGDMGWFTRQTLEPTYLEIVDTLNTGQICEPVYIEGKFHLFRLDNKKDERELNLEDDWEQIALLAKNQLFSQKLGGFLEVWRKEVNIQNLSSFYVTGDPLIFKNN